VSVVRVRPAQMPGIRDGFARAGRELSRLKSTRRWDIDPELADFFDSMPRLADAEMFLASPDATTLAVEAAHDMQWFDPATRPSEAGLMVFARHLPLVTVERHPTAPYRSAAPCILTWVPSPSRHGEVHAALFSRCDDVVLKDGRTCPPNAVTGEWELSMCALVDPEVIDLGELARSDAASAVILSLIAATWSLMQTPSMTQVKDAPPPTARKARKAASKQSSSPVRLVTLRAPGDHPEHAEKTESTSKRTYTHRWPVRPHPRQQRCGPKLGEVKTTWIPGYIKGPRDAPLRERPVVYVWRG